MEEVSFQTKDGLTLKGSFSLLDPERPTVLLCHGVAANRTDLYPFAQLLYEKGRMNLLSFDFRAHGESGGHLASWGPHERKDLEAALDFLDQKPLRRDYGVMGISMGGAVGILVAADDKRIKALWIDSPYTNLAESIETHLKLLYHLPRFPFLPFALFSYRILFRTAAQEASPIDVIDQIAPRPLMIVNGASDPQMLPEGARRLYEKAGEPKSLWLIPGAGHLEGHALEPETYHQRLVDFFEKAFSENR